MEKPFNQKNLIEEEITKIRKQLNQLEKCSDPQFIARYKAHLIREIEKLKKKLAKS